MAIETPMRHPDEILADFDAAVQGRADIDPREILWEIIEDIQHSYALAMETDERVDDFAAADVSATVSDYLVNHYGDD